MWIWSETEPQQDFPSTCSLPTLCYWLVSEPGGPGRRAQARNRRAEPLCGAGAGRVVRQEQSLGLIWSVAAQTPHSEECNGVGGVRGGDAWGGMDRGSQQRLSHLGGP